MKDLNKWKQNIKLLLLTFKKLYLLQVQIYRERRNREIHSICWFTTQMVRRSWAHSKPGARSFLSVSPVVAESQGFGLPSNALTDHR